MSTGGTTTTSPDELPGWLRLTSAPGLGPVAARQLLATFGLPAQILAASHTELTRTLPDATARALLAPPSDALRAQIDRTREWMDLPINHVITRADTAYPQKLLELPDPPTLLYVTGRLDLLERHAIGIVGARNATAQGMQNAEAFAKALAGMGETIVSGLALGIDTAAHAGALESTAHDEGSTIAVIGTGADIVYPARNRALAHRIAENGAIVSEFPLGTPAAPFHFPRRNRVIAGLSRGVLVVEAAARSGSLITARMAAEQGREVFAIPGSIHSPLSKGCHALIRQGAKLVESAQDILEELAPQHTPPRLSEPLTPLAPQQDDDPLLAALGYDPVALDALCSRMAQPAGELLARLFMLELAGQVERRPGNIFQRLTQRQA